MSKDRKAFTELSVFCRWDFTFWIPSSQITSQKGLTALFIQYVKIKPVKRVPEEFSYFWVRKSIKLISETTYQAYRYNVEGKVPIQLILPSIFPFELLTQSRLYLIHFNRGGRSKWGKSPFPSWLPKNLIYYTLKKDHGWLKKNSFFFVLAPRCDECCFRVLTKSHQETIICLLHEKC